MGLWVVQQVGLVGVEPDIAQLGTEASLDHAVLAGAGRGVDVIGGQLEQHLVRLVGTQLIQRSTHGAGVQPWACILHALKHVERTGHIGLDSLELVNNDLVLGQLQAQVQLALIVQAAGGHLLKQAVQLLGAFVMHHHGTSQLLGQAAAAHCDLHVFASQSCLEKLLWHTSVDGLHVDRPQRHAGILAGKVVTSCADGGSQAVVVGPSAADRGVRWRCLANALHLQEHALVCNGVHLGHIDRARLGCDLHGSRRHGRNRRGHRLGGTGRGDGWSLVHQLGFFGCACACLGQTLENAHAETGNLHAFLLRHVRHAHLGRGWQ